MDVKPHIRSLDGLRGLAALTVVVSHLDLLFPQAAWAASLSVGNEAVTLFFSLSGFLMAYLYGGRVLNGPAARDYLLHRFARIYPVYAVAVLAVAGLSLLPLGFPQPILGLEAIGRHLAMLGSSGVFWSIPPEIQFYLFFLLLWFWFERPVKRWPVGGGIALVFALLWFTGFPGPGILLASKIAYFLLGALAGRLFALTMSKPGGRAIGIAALAAVALHFLCFKLVLDRSGFWGMTSAATAMLAVALVAREGRFSRTVFAGAPLCFIGRISFSLYLFHMPVMYLVSRSLPTGVGEAGTALLMVLSAVLFASLSHICIERPSRKGIIALAAALPSRAPLTAVRSANPYT